MADVDDILVDNLGDGLRQAQRFVVTGIVSAALMFLLSIRAPELLSLKENTTVPVLGEVAPGLGFVILFLAYFTSGCLANSAISRIVKTAKLLEAPIAEAVLTQFSVVTIENRVMRLGTILLAPLITMIAYVFEKYRSGTMSTWWMGVPGVALYGAPYLLLAWRLCHRKPIEVMPSQGAS